MSGTLNDGKLFVDSDHGENIVRLILDGVTINYSNSVAIFVKEYVKALIILEVGPENVLTSSDDGDNHRQQLECSALDQELQKIPVGRLFFIWPGKGINI